VPHPARQGHRARHAPAADRRLTVDRAVRCRQHHEPCLGSARRERARRDRLRRAYHYLAERYPGRGAAGRSRSPGDRAAAADRRAARAGGSAGRGGPPAHRQPTSQGVVHALEQYDARSRGRGGLLWSLTPTHGR
jgi:hypothetical protein